MAGKNARLMLLTLISFLFLIPCAVIAAETLECGKVFLLGPAIDAKFDDLAWKGAKAAVFPHPNGDTVEVRAVYDDKNLYLAVAGREADIDRTVAAAGSNGKNAVNYAEDELLDLAFIANTAGGWEIHRLVLNPAGAISCLLDDTPGPVPVPNVYNKWDVKLRSAMLLDKKACLWKAELEIPLASLGFDAKDGAKSYFTAARYLHANLTSDKWVLAAFGKYAGPSLSERTAKWKEYEDKTMCVKFRIPADASAGFNGNNNSTEVSIKNPYINSSAFISAVNGKCGPNGENFDCGRGGAIKNLAGDELPVSCQVDYGMCNVERNVVYMLDKAGKCMNFSVNLRTASAGCLYPDGIQPVAQDFDVTTSVLEDIILTAGPIDGCALPTPPAK